MHVSTPTAISPRLFIVRVSVVRYRLFSSLTDRGERRCWLFHAGASAWRNPQPCGDFLQAERLDCVLPTYSFRPTSVVMLA